MSDAERERLARERADADRAYNEALTAVDRAIADTRGRELARDDFDRLSHALVQLLQRITAFVESKDRALVGDVDNRVEPIGRALGEIAELRTRVNVLQRNSRQFTVDSSQTAAGGRQLPAASPQPPAASPQPPAAPQADAVYVGFEDEFRGSDADVAAKLRGYLPLFAGTTDVVDLGCGRGEFLHLLRENGVHGRGVDTNAEMVAAARARGLDVDCGDALGFLAGLPDESIGGAIATQVVEHLEPAYLARLLATLSRTLRPGAPVVLETINPTCWLAFFSSYLRDFTHVRPIHPDTLQYLLRANGFERVTIRYSAPVPDEMKLRTVDLPAAVLTSTDPSIAALAQVGHAVNANAAILNALLFSYLDYAAIGYRA